MKCILHIGTEKTGTTLLQDWLYDNRKALSAQGIALTSSAAAPNNRRLAASVMQEPDDFFRRLGLLEPGKAEAFFATFRAEFTAEVQALAKTHDTLVLTSEHFHSRLETVEEIRALRAFLAPLVEDIVVLCYFREQSEVRRSLYSTALWVGVSTGPIDGFQRHNDERDHYYNYELMFGKWAEVFGEDALRPRLYGTAHFEGGDIRRDFLAQLGRDVDAAKLSWKVTTANTSFGRLKSVIARALNIAQPQYVKDRYNDTRHRLMARIAEADALDSGPLTSPGQAEFHARFDASNRRFAERFLGRTGNPFPAPDDTPRSAGEAQIEAALLEGMQAVFARPGLVVIGKEEARRLRDMALRLHKAGQVHDARFLLRMAVRAVPGLPKAQSTLEAWEAEAQKAPAR
ncbi:hypothetical protein [Mesobacterium pallidum]|uniref:hypothetical protein n=1 Tax=Mesobacterium pallidum TaxID=2872037 RepID=UPI001EE39C1A|nr:hypothetical protein [Mesobacterium pallidum]